MGQHRYYPCVPVPTIGGPAPSGWMGYLILGPKGAFTNALTSYWSWIDQFHPPNIITGCTISTATPPVVTVPGGTLLPSIGEKIDVNLEGCTVGAGSTALNKEHVGCTILSATTFSLPTSAVVVSPTGTFRISYISRRSGDVSVASTELTSFGAGTSTLGIINTNSLTYGRQAGGHIESWRHASVNILTAAEVTNQEILCLNKGYGRGIQSALFLRTPHPDFPTSTTAWRSFNPTQAGSDPESKDEDDGREIKKHGSPCISFRDRLYRIEPIAPPIQASSAEVLVEAVPMEWSGDGHGDEQFTPIRILANKGGGPYTPVICPDLKMGQKVLQNALSFGTTTASETSEIHRYRATLHVTEPIDIAPGQVWTFQAPISTFRGCAASCVQDALNGQATDLANTKVGFFNRAYFMRARRADNLAELVDLTNAGLWAATGSATLNQTVPDKTITAVTAGLTPTVTFTTATAQFYPEFGGVPGDRMFVYVDITGCNDANINGRHLARVVTSTTLQLTLSVASLGTGNTGTIRFRLVPASGGNPMTKSTLPMENGGTIIFHPTATTFGGGPGGPYVDTALPWAPQSLYYPQVGVMLGCWNTNFNDGGQPAMSTGYLAVAQVARLWRHPASGAMLANSTGQSIETSARLGAPTQGSQTWERGTSTLELAGYSYPTIASTAVGPEDLPFTLLNNTISGAAFEYGTSGQLEGGTHEFNSYFITASGTTYLEAVMRCRDKLTYIVTHGIG